MTDDQVVGWPPELTPVFRQLQVCCSACVGTMHPAYCTGMPGDGPLWRD